MLPSMDGICYLFNVIIRKNVDYVNLGVAGCLLINSRCCIDVSPPVSRSYRELNLDNWGSIMYV